MGAFDKMVLDLIHEIFEGNKGLQRVESTSPFATAITPDGSVSHLETVTITFRSAILSMGMMEQKNYFSEAFDEAALAGV